MKRVLVTGAAGFLGKALVKKAVEMGWKVDGLFRSDANVFGTEVQDVYFPSDLHKLSNIPYDFIFHAAAFRQHGMYDKYHPGYLESNVKLVLNIHEMFPKAKLVFISSVSVYGAPIGTISELSQPKHPSVYGRSKAVGEFIVQHHSNYSILRLASLVGPGMDPETFIPKIISSARKHSKIILFGDGGRLQNYLSVHDAARYCIASALIPENDTYLIVDSKSYSNLEVASMVKKFIPCDIEFIGEDNASSFEYDNSVSLEKLSVGTPQDFSLVLKEIINE